MQCRLLPIPNAEFTSYGTNNAALNTTVIFQSSITHIHTESHYVYSHEHWCESHYSNDAVLHAELHSTNNCTRFDKQNFPFLLECSHY